jgi:serine/threonine protein phosphatase 1
MAAASVPSGFRVYAIGDIHGRLDLLSRLHQMILDDARGAALDARVLVYLGDYVDRGPDSAGVVDLLSQRTLPDFTAVHLMGNHEDFMLRFLDDTSSGSGWFANGGVATLRSYGVEFAYDDLLSPERLRDRLSRRVPSRHLDFLRGLALSRVIGGYLFVHAGIRPGIAMELQTPADLMWIRGDFLNSGVEHGKIVVHGHTITDYPEVRPNRIGIDTGAFATGRLTCLVLEGDSRRFLHTGGALT